MKIQKTRAAWFASLAVAATLCVQSSAAVAQEVVEDRPSTIEAPEAAPVGTAPVGIAPLALRPDTSSVFSDLFAPLASDFRAMASPQNLIIGGAIGAGAAAAHHFDARVASSTTWPLGTRDAFKPGQHVGDFLMQTGGAVATYTIGRVSGSPRIARTGAAIFRAQLVSQGTAQVIKLATGRTRPDGTSHSFPSGHTASAFATATVLQSEFGWKAAVPAYGIAAWVAASRIEAGRHFVSDVVAGAAVGILAGRSVTIGRGDARFALSPMATPGGAGVTFTKLSK